MASKNVVNKLKTKPSTSKDSDINVNAITELTEDLEIGGEETLDLDEVIRSLNDEYKKLKANPVERVRSEKLSKSNTKSADLRDVAETLAKKGLHHESLPWYTESVAFAEHGSEELALAYSKRAESLYRLHLYDQCVQDINRAVAGIHCSASVREKLEKRKYQCFIERRKANTIIQMKLSPVPGALFDIVEVDSNFASPADVEGAQREWRGMCKFDNTHIPNASSKIRLAYDKKKWGRYVEATEDLEAGEVVASQKWFTAFVNEKLMFQRCSYCLSLSAALISCPTCSQMMYCSETCCDLAYESYHRLECEVMKIFFVHDTLDNVKFYMLRELLTGTEQGAQLENLMKRMTVRDLMKKDDSPASETFVDEYATSLSLHETPQLDHVKTFVQSVARMIETLEYAGFFDGDPSFRADPENKGTLTEAQIFAAFLLLNNAVGKMTNYFTFSIVRGTIGLGSFALYSALNHSCDPNIFLISRNQREMAIITYRPIKKGEELVILYPALERKVDSQKRITRLFASRDFLCQCVACLNHWSITDVAVLDKTLPVFHNHVKQKKAKRELKTLISPVVRVEEVTSLSVGELLRIFIDVCKWIFLNIERPSFEHVHVQNLTYVFTALRYDQFICEYISTEDIIRHAQTVLRRVADRFDIEVSTIPAPASSKKNIPFFLIGR